LPAINNLINDNKDVQAEKISEKIAQSPEIKNCSEKEVVCPSLNKKCTEDLILQYGGGCAASFGECNIGEPDCPKNLENK